MEMNLRVGVIGVGGVGELLLKEFLNHPGSNVVGIYDTNPSRMNEISEKYNVPNFEHYIDLIEDARINFVYIAVPPKYHHAIAIEAMKRNKHVICEKPLANSIEEAEDLFSIANERNIIHVMNFPTIYRQCFLTLQEYLSKGDIGELQRVEIQCYFPEWPRQWQQNSWIRSREQGGFIREVFPHYIQMVQMLFGEIDIQYSLVKFPEDTEQCETSFLAHGEVKGHIPVLFNGISGIGQMEDIKFSIIGSEGVMALENWRTLSIKTRNRASETIALSERNHLQIFIDEIIKKLNNEESSVITFREGLEVQKVLENLLGK
ncbi:putative dehydrogenase [Bacillus sp. SORGH_AS 510]|uniref:Gfo/Idh/MocA family protein n=1 Tax=Bacillus sp. SORGH_AS_0510 TaxID=3041771 RepID=UPI00277ECFA1|nr:Gfo/Idh/MocA family oxidoreductase [Bacillus sp. SORGH_AS_0510]MDQ1143986.1 putative dehydrogenase [Bacillus sp. SORGH_AS_0510]